MSEELYQQVTDKVIAMMENPGQWEKPWTCIADGGPFNAVTRRPYQGINVLVLGMESETKGYKYPAWGTFRRWKGAGGWVRKGEKGTLVVWHGMVADATKKNGDGSPKMFPVLRHHYVFNADQVNGADEVKAKLSAADKPSLFDRIKKAEKAVKNTKAEIRYGGSEACYNFVLDYIKIPNAETFKGTKTSTAQESFYATTFHEFGHWTGHESRLAREFGRRFGSEAYAFEELVAELTAAFLCARVQIASEPRPDHAHYLKHWLRVLKGDNRAIFTAASAATKAANLIIPIAKIDDDSDDGSD